MIIDASVAFKWLVSEEDSDKALAFIGHHPLIAPNLIFAEVGNALWRQMSRGQTAADEEPGDYLDALGQIVSTVDDAPLIPRALEIAIEINHPIYDCVYLALAEQLEDVVVSADKRLLAKVVGTRFADLLRPL